MCSERFKQTFKLCKQCTFSTTVAQCLYKVSRIEKGILVAVILADTKTPLNIGDLKLHFQHVASAMCCAAAVSVHRLGYNMECST